MAETSPPPPSPRRGPPPPPPGAASAAGGATLSGAVAQLIELGQDELPRMADQARAAELRVRLAMLAWDGQGDPIAAAAWIEGVEQHPAAAALRRDLALASEHAAALEKLGDQAIAEREVRREPSELAELGELILWRCGDAVRAVQLLQAAGAPGRDALALALDLAGRHEPRAALLEQIGDPPSLLEAAALHEERLGEPGRARSLLRRALEAGAGLTATERACALEKLLALEGQPRGERLQLLRDKLALLSDDPASAPERAATQLELGLELGRGAEAVAEAEALMRPLASERNGFGSQLALRNHAHLLAARGDFGGAAAAWVALSERCDPSPWSRACARRAAELLDAREGDSLRAEAIYAGLHDIEPADPAVTRALVRLRLARRAPAEAALALDAHARARPADSGALLVTAARAAEAAEALVKGAPPRAPAPGRPQAPSGAAAVPSAQLRWRAAERSVPTREPLEAIARAERRDGQRLALADTYRRLAPHVDPTRAAAQLTVAGVLALDQGAHAEAEDLLREAATRAPWDLLAHAARALTAQAAGEPRALAEALTAQVELVENPATRARLLRNLARTSARDLGDIQVAETSYERALAIQPDDAATLYELSRLAGDLGKWARAVELRDRAATLAGGEPAIAWLCEVAEIHDAKLDDPARARAAFERALAIEPGSRRVLAALAALHRKHGRLPELLDVLRQERDLAESGPLRLAAELAIAQAAEEGRAADTALAAYAGALAIDPGNSEAVAGVTRICRAESRWSELAETLSAAPSARTDRAILRTLDECWSQLGDWLKVAEVREIDVMLPEVAADPAEQARLARELAALYEEKLDDPDAAARAWHRVDEAVGDVAAVRALERIYEARGRFADLAAAIERELQLISRELDGRPAEPDLPPPHARAVDLWMRLGEIRKSQLGRFLAAAEAYERVLALDETHAGALGALSELYAKLDRPRDLERVIELRAGQTEDPQQRATLLLQKGELAERTGDYDAALATFQSAFRLDPANRSAFTSLERVCYRRERWPDAMALYDLAIDLVEVRRSRAYRLADLYARRGQVQLQYLSQPGEAAASYLKVLDLDPESDLAQTALERIFSTQTDWNALIRAYERRAELVSDDGKRAEILRRAARVAAAKLRDAKRAGELYQRLHAVDPTDAEALDSLERHYEHSREWEKLVDVLRTRIALTTGGDDAIKLYLRIAQLCEEGMRSPERAIEAYRKILDAAPSHREALDALGRLYEATEKWAELVEITRRQIRVVSDRTQKALLYFKCGSVMESKFAKDDDAIRYYDAAIRTSASCLPAVHGLRDLYLRREDWPRVIQSLELEAKLWTEEKERAGVLAHIGNIYGDKLGDTERAIWYFESALGVDKGCLPANRALFEIYFGRGDFVHALPLGTSLTQKVMREGDPAERSEFYRKRAVVARETGDLPGAAESLVVALEIRPENLGALDLLVELCRRDPSVYDFATTFRELEKLFRKREAGAGLARVLVAQGALREREYEIDQAEQLYLEALGLAPDDYPVIDALVDLHVKLRRFDAGATVLEVFLDRSQDPPARARARFRLAEVYGDCALDPRRAAEALRALTAEMPELCEAHYRLAQELYLLRGFGEALKVCERLIQLAAAPGQTAPPEDLARYYDYLGRISEAMGDPQGAARSYRRAVELDPAYAPPVLALARRAHAAGDAAQAQRLLDSGVSAATARGEASLLAIQRGTARFLVETGDRGRAIDLYRRILARAPDSADDRVAVAALYALDATLARPALEELAYVLQRDLRHAPAYRLLMHLYSHAGAASRAGRVAAILTLLGYADTTDRALPPYAPTVRRTPLVDELRKRLLVSPIVVGPYAEALAAVREPLEGAYPYPALADLQPIADPAFRVCIVEVERLMGIEADVLTARAVPGGVLAFESPRPTVVIEAQLAQRPERERRFLIGRALEPLRGGYALVLRLRPQERAELGRLVLQLLKPEGARDAQAQEFVKQLPRKSARAVERLAQLGPAIGTLDDWYTHLGIAADRAGLLACDDVNAAAAMMARLGGEELAVTAEGAVALGQVAGGAELVRYFLSDGYHDLGVALGDAPH